MKKSTIFLFEKERGKGNLGGKLYSEIFTQILRQELKQIF